MSAPEPSEVPAAESSPAPGGRGPRRRLFTVAALVGGVLLLALWGAQQTIGSAPPPILPPAGEALAGSVPFTFAVGGDSKDNTAIFESILSRIQADHPALILHTGDIVKRNSAAQYTWVLDELAEAHLSVPLCVVPGNHDINARSVAPGERYRFYERSFGPREYWFSYANALFVAFDDATQSCAQADLDWLDRTLGRFRGQYALCFVFMHVPPRDPREGRTHCLPKEDAEKLTAILSKHHVSAVIAGHIHSYLVGKASSVPVYISGGEGANLDAPLSEGYHYLLCTVNKDGTFTLTKHDVPARSDDDALEHAFRTKLPPPLVLFAAAVLLTVGVLRLRGARH